MKSRGWTFEKRQRGRAVLETEEIDLLRKSQTLGSFTDLLEICAHEFKVRPVIMEVPQLLVWQVSGKWSGGFQQHWAVKEGEICEGLMGLKW